MEFMKPLKKDGKEGRDFLLQNRRIFLTYKTHVDKEALRDFLKEIFPDTKRCEIAHETGDEQCPYDHTHVFIDCGKAKKVYNCRTLDLEFYNDDGEIDEVIHPHIQCILTAAHEKNVLVYLGKEDPECANLCPEETETNMMDAIWGCSTLQEALRKYAKSPANVQGVIAAWNARPATEGVFNETILRGWQIEAEDLLVNSKPSKRDFWWNYCKKGGSGKSVFCNYMQDTYPKDVALMTQFGKAADAYNNIKTFLENGWTGKILICDLSRSFDGRESIYDPLECIKNGRITCTKYTGGSMRLPNIPHVMIFANFMPVFEKVSQDRWKIQEFYTDKDELDEEGKPTRKNRIVKLKEAIAIRRSDEDAIIRKEYKKRLYEDKLLAELEDEFGELKFSKNGKPRTTKTKSDVFSMSP